MKKLFNLALVGTMVLAAAACQREQVGDSPTPVKGEEVTTQFVLNVTSAPQTKMTADAVQQNHNFRGIKDGVINTYATGTNLVLSSAATATKTFNFPTFFNSKGLDNSGTNNQTDENGNASTASKRVLQLSIPVETDAILFYGKAMKGDGARPSDYGESALATHIDPVPDNTVIACRPILNETNKTNYDKTGALMIYIINYVLGTSVDVDSDGGKIGSYEYTSLPALSWAQLGHQYEIDKYTADGTNRYAPQYGLDHSVTGLEEVLGKCYYLFTYLQPADLPDGMTFGSEEWSAWAKANPTLRHHPEYRAGSSAAIKSMIIDMYKIITSAKDAEPTNDYEANAKRLANTILENAALFFDTATGDYKEISILKNSTVLKDDWSKYFEGAKDLDKYPYEDFGIPEGAAQIAFRAQSATQMTDEFYYRDPNQPLVNPGMESFEPRKYIYPAELWYYVNSSIRTSTDGNITTADYPDGISKWNAAASWTGWTSPGVVASSTRAVAVTSPINYGVALLKSNVSYSATTLKDNRKALTDESTDRSFSIGAAHLQLRGVLVGGQNPRMNWQFIRKYTDTSAKPEAGSNDSFALFDGVVYDHAFGTTTSTGGNVVDVPLEIPSSTSSSATTYTLVYDNYNSTGTGATEADRQNDVFVALEFVNGGESFWGKDNLIPKDGVFYLVAKLPKPTANDNITWPSDHQIPPVNASTGVSLNVARVFIQDFMTTANFRIGENSLKNAYYSIPDLRASQMSLGLSVDLKWESGITYNLDL